jgi:glucosamine kinase
MAFFLGIDAGGTKTRCVVGDEHGVVGRSQGSSCKIQRVGEAEARHALHAVVTEACQAAGVSAGKIGQVCIGISGASNPDVAELVRRILGEVVSAPVEVLGDITVAQEAAFGDSAGCMVVAGTGSIAVGRNEEGTMARAGGWGPEVSDEGSGYWIGRAAVAATLRALDAGESTALLAGILDAWRLATCEDFIRAASVSPPLDFVQIFPKVLQAAEQDDELAGEILRRAGCELAELALAVIRRLWPGTQWVRVAISGGILENSALTRLALAGALRNARPQIAISFAHIEPVMGALALARKTRANHQGHKERIEGHEGKQKRLLKNKQ